MSNSHTIRTGKVLAGSLIGSVVLGVSLMILRAVLFVPQIEYGHDEPQSSAAAAYHGAFQGILAGAVLGAMAGAIVRGVASACELWKKSSTPAPDTSADGQPAGTPLRDWALTHSFTPPGTHDSLTDYTYAEDAPPDETVP